jgi:shikimate dehydrogenase
VSAAARFEIDGETGIVLIVADPVSHVRTPQRFNAYLREIGANAVLVPAHVARHELPAVLEGCRRMRNLHGLIVTIPHKIDIVGLCDSLDDSAALAGAVNVVRRTRSGEFIGGNYDGTGFVRSIRDLAGVLIGKDVFMAGAGGVARSIAFAFAEAGVARLTIANRTESRAVELAKAVHDAFPNTETELGKADPAGFHIALNASSLGLHAGDPLPFSIEGLSRDTLIADVVMQPLMTRLLLAAQERGHPICTGDRMLEHQLRAFVSFLEIGRASTDAHRSESEPGSGH